MLLDIYDKAMNNSVLNDVVFLNDCLDIYSAFDNETSLKEIYYYIVSSYEVDNSNIDNSSFLNFYVSMTNKWIYSVLSLNEYNLHNYDIQGYRSYRVIQSILQKFGYVKNLDDIKKLYDLMSSLIFDKSLDSDYFWRRMNKPKETLSFNEFETQFLHVSSNYINSFKFDFSDISYRIYVNAANEDLFEFLSDYVNLCEEAKIPYYFKFCSSGVRQDKIVIYSSLYNLKPNINILRNIGKNNPKIIYDTGSVCRLSANVDGWFGLSAEPKNEFGDSYSFNVLRSKILEEAAMISALNYINVNLDEVLKIGEVSVNFKDIIFDISMYVINNNGYLSKDIDKNKISRYFENQLLKKILDGFIYVSNGKDFSSDFTFFDDVSVKIDSFLIHEIIKSILVIIRKVDSGFVFKYRQTIKNVCLKYNVDVDNFAFNDDTFSEFKHMSAAHFK